jgi:hypothetical protein
MPLKPMWTFPDLRGEPRRVWRRWMFRPNSPPVVHSSTVYRQWCGISLSDILYRNIPRFHALYYYYY